MNIVSKDKFKKVMEEYKSKKLHSGSKSGPLVKSKDQAVAIAVSESKKNKGKNGQKDKKD